MPEAIDFSEASHQYMEMHTGSRFYISDPVFNMDEICYALSNQRRWNGTSSRDMTVAEHSVRVSYETEGDPLEGLLHDMTETYLGDVPGPWKALLPDFCSLEQYLWGAFIDWFDVTYPNCAGRLQKKMKPETKAADWRVLFIEAREIMPSQGRGWVGEDNYACTVMDPPCYFWTPAEAEQRFHMRFQELTWDT